MGEVEHCQIDVGHGVELHVAATGPKDGKPVLLLHGFPELCFSWRKQLEPLAAAGYRVIAPDNRGYGGSSRPEAIEAYDNASLTEDVVGLLDHFGYEQAAVFGHDWGAFLTWHLGLAVPERVAVIGGLSVPAVPRAPAEPLAIMRHKFGETFYIVWFQEPGVAEAALESDVRRTLSTTKVWTEDWVASDDDPPTPKFMTDEELQVYVDAFTETGFRGGLNWYRNIDRNWHANAVYEGHTIDMPAFFLVGERDPTNLFMPKEAMDGYVTDLRSVTVLEGAGHWVQQERPDEVNAALLDFLAETYPA
ncbi:MAG: alpha/beta hydrolase [Solirubrobacteraceae bacterium]|nr:alpha/beta hydrolase [Solirubrobacteraceae bacterium]